jgi:hypothetical protein
VSTKLPYESIQKPHIGETILFLGNLNFDLDVDATLFRTLLTDNGYVLTVVPSAPSNITLSYLNQYDAIVLSDLSGSVSASEADIFYSYVVDHSGNLLILGQLTGFPSGDRNIIGDKFGIHFNNDLFCDPQSHYLFNGECDVSDGDPDNGVEYVFLQSFTMHPVTNGVNFFDLNWGQSLSVSGSAQAIAFGSAASWGDENPVWTEPPADCDWGWYINTDDTWEQHGDLVGIAAFESGGKVVGIGDQDMLWDSWFYGDQVTLFSNIFIWFFQTQVEHIADNLYVLPKDYILYQNFPNPFNPSTKIVYSVPKKSKLSIKLFDFLGRELLTLMDSERVPGLYEIEFNASNLSSGIYFYVLESGNTRLAKKMILLK